MGPYDCLLDTAANCSLVRKKTLLENLNRCQTVNFDGIGGTLAISQKGHLGPLFYVYYHPAATANIISLSSIKESRYLVTYSDKRECFIVDLDKGTRTFNKGTDGLYICNFSQPAGMYVTIATTVADLKRELAEAAQALPSQPPGC